jgi:hypothetical protein
MAELRQKIDCLFPLIFADGGCRFQYVVQTFMTLLQGKGRYLVHHYPPLS